MLVFFRPCLGILFLTLAAVSAVRADDGPTARRTFDAAIAPGIGYFFYPQYVEDGYYINGRPYDLVWSGTQMHFTGDAHWYFPSKPNLGLGGAVAYMLAPHPSGSDWGNTVSADPHRRARGGYFAVSGCFWPTERWRLEARSGYGGTGVDVSGGSYGGWGLMLGLAAHRLFGSGPLAVGVGLRALSMVLSSPSHGTTRGEWGVHSSLLFEVLFDYARKH
jgi:hypothetical protein